MARLTNIPEGPLRDLAGMLPRKVRRSMPPGELTARLVQARDMLQAAGQRMSPDLLLGAMIECRKSELLARAGEGLSAAAAAGDDELAGEYREILGRVPGLGK